MNLKAKPKINSDISIRQIDDNNWFLANCKEGDVYKINKTSYIIVEQVNGEKDIEQIISSVTNKYPSVVDDDIIQLVEFMYEKKIIM